MNKANEPDTPQRPLGEFSSLGLLGLSSPVPVEAAQKWSTALTTVWVTQFGRPIAMIADDFVALDAFFNPTRKGEAVRMALSKVGSVQIEPEAVPLFPSDDRFLLAVGPGRHLVTPEGR